MIDLTPLDVRKKKGDFRRAMRGYEPALVDDFLDLAADRMEELVRQTRALEEKVERLERAESEYKEREKALTEALVTAQEMRAEVRNQALREADLAKKEAEQEARRIRAEALEAKEREKEGIRRLQARRAQLVRSYRAFLEREIAELEVMSRALEGFEPEESEPQSEEPASPAPRAAAAPPPSQSPTKSSEPLESSLPPMSSAPSSLPSFSEEEEDALVREMNAILAQQEPQGPPSDDVELFLSDDDVVPGGPSFLEEELPPSSESGIGLTLREDGEPKPAERPQEDDDPDDLVSRMFEH